MVTENVDIRFRESGSRVIVRKIEEIGEAANRSTRGLFLMQRALFTLGGASLIAGLSRQLDMLTNVENRLRLTSTSTQNLEAVQRSLFQVARDTRSAFESVAEIYSRTALSVKNLGVTQKEAIRFTESLAKASILSGASTREANAALIQLSQGLASNRLSGDELRSVLEQLPFVADVIAKKMKITRGELRKFGSEGKISAGIVLEAFRDARDEIDTLFSQTQATISQALSVANANWLEFLDNLDDTVMISGAVADAIILISDNIAEIINGLTLLAAAFAISFGVRQLANIFKFIGALRAGAVASARLREVEELRQAANARRAGVAVAANRARQVELSQRLRMIQIKKADLQQTVLDTQFTVANGRARNISTGRYVGLTSAKAALTRASQQLATVEAVEAVTAGRLATARAAQLGTTTTAARANQSLAAAQAANAAGATRLSRVFPTLAGTLALVGRGFASLFALIAANPFGAIVTGVIAAGAAIYTFGDRIKLTEDGIVNLRNFTVAAFQIIGEKISSVAGTMKEVFGKAVTEISGLGVSIPDDWGAGLEVLLNVVKSVVNKTIGAFYGAYKAIVAVWDLLPKALGNVGKKAANALIDAIEGAINGVLNGVQKLLGAIGSAASIFNGGVNPFADIIGKDPLDLSQYKSTVTEGGADLGAAASTAFKEGFNRDFVGETIGSIQSVIDDGVASIIDRARTNANAAAEDLLFGQSVLDTSLGDKVDVPGDKDKDSGKTSTSFLKEIAELREKIALEQMYGLQKKITIEQLRIEEAIKRKLTESESKLLSNLVKELELSKIKGEVLESILGPQEELILGQIALNQLFESGAITLENYITRLRELQIAADNAAGTLAGGFRAAIASSIMSANEIGNALGNIVVGGANKAADALVQFAQTGKINMRAFFHDLFSQLMRLAAQQLLLRLLGGFMGVPIAPVGLGFGGGGSILPGFSTGGSIMPTGAGSTDTQMVAFNKRPDERVDILTPGQQKYQRDRMNGRQSEKEEKDLNVTNLNIFDLSMLPAILSTNEAKRVIKNVITEEGLLQGLEGSF